jgi:hypothetical protein
LQEEPVAVWWLQARKAVAKPTHKGFDTLIWLVVWSIWREQNHRIHEWTALQPVVFTGSILEEPWLWAQAGFVWCETWVPMVPTDQGPRGFCQVDPTCQKPCRPASGPEDLIHSPGDLGRPQTTSSRLQTTCQACGASLSLDHGGAATSRPEDRGILSVITEGDHPKICNRHR